MADINNPVEVRLRWMAGGRDRQTGKQTVSRGMHDLRERRRDRQRAGNRIKIKASRNKVGQTDRQQVGETDRRVSRR